MEHHSACRPGYDLKCADLHQGQVSWTGVIEEAGHAAIMCLRLAFRGDAISEIETIVCRAHELGPFPQIEGYDAPRPLMLADVPVDQRAPRDRLISIADGYFDTIQLNDGTLFTEFTDDCDRIENGLQTTNTDIAGYPIAQMARRTSSASASTSMTIACATGASRWWTRRRASCWRQGSSTMRARCWM